MIAFARHIWSVGIAAILLAACAEIPTPANTASPSARTYQESINIDGRLSVQYQQDGREEAVHGNFSWSQSPAHTMITLNSPLGQTLATIDVTADQATLKQSGQAPRTAKDANQLTELALGWPLPIAGMRDWLQGIARDRNGQHFVASDRNDATANVATQDGWRIHYVSWQNDGPAASHPKRIDMVRNTPQAGVVSIRLVIDTWQPH